MTKRFGALANATAGIAFVNTDNKNQHKHTDKRISKAEENNPKNMASFKASLMKRKCLPSTHMVIQFMG